MIGNARQVLAVCDELGIIVEVAPSRQLRYFGERSAVLSILDDLKKHSYEIRAYLEERTIDSHTRH